MSRRPVRFFVYDLRPEDNIWLEDNMTVMSVEFVKVRTSDRPLFSERLRVVVMEEGVLPVPARTRDDA